MSREAQHVTATGRRLGGRRDDRAGRDGLRQQQRRRQSGGASSAAPSGPVTLTMWYWGDQEAHGLSTFLANSVTQVRGPPPEHHDQHGAAVHRQPDAELRRRGEGQEGAGHRVPLGRHLGAAGRLGRQPRADLRLHPGGRARPLPELVRGHLGRQALERAVVRRSRRSRSCTARTSSPAPASPRRRPPGTSSSPTARRCARRASPRSPAASRTAGSAAGCSRSSGRSR